jgi:hypothetical protein
MANYVFAYSGGKGVAADETERNAQYAKWGQWFEQLGSAVVDGGAAMGTAKTVGSGGSVSDGGSTKRACQRPTSAGYFLGAPLHGVDAAQLLWLRAWAHRGTFADS